MYPQDNVVCYHIPARDNFPACKCYVYDHDGLTPEVMKETGEEVRASSGRRGHALRRRPRAISSNDARIIPEAEHQKFPAPPKTLPRAKAGGPIEDLYACIRNGGTPASRTSPTRPAR